MKRITKVPGTIIISAPLSGIEVLTPVAAHRAVPVSINDLIEVAPGSDFTAAVNISQAADSNAGQQGELSNGSTLAEI